jgi:hypothetical protein
MLRRACGVVKWVSRHSPGGNRQAPKQLSHPYMRAWQLLASSCLPIVIWTLAALSIPGWGCPTEQHACCGCAVCGSQDCRPGLGQLQLALCSNPLYCMWGGFQQLCTRCACGQCNGGAAPFVREERAAPVQQNSRFRETSESPAVITQTEASVVRYSCLGIAALHAFCLVRFRVQMFSLLRCPTSLCPTTDLLSNVATVCNDWLQSATPRAA